MPANTSSSSKPGDAKQPTPAPTKAPEPEPHVDRCPDCRARLELYDGYNPHKIGQGFCPKCRGRKPLGH